MLRERAISSLLTLNFDLAMSHALAIVGASADVGIIREPANDLPLGASNLIFLHRTVLADPEEWILTKSALNDEWQGAWEEFITTKVLVTPVVIFAGLGSPAGVLVECTAKVGKALGSAVEVFQVDPEPWGSSQFTDSLGISESEYLQSGWVAFMTLLSKRLAQEHRAEIEKACEDLQNENGWTPEDPTELCDRLEALGLLEFGRLRASWMLIKQRYMPCHAADPRLIADLLLVISLVERTTGGIAILRGDGIVDLESPDGKKLGSFLIGSGSGHERPATLEAKMRHKEVDHPHARPSHLLVSGVTGARVLSPPKSIVSEEDPESIVGGGGRTFVMIHADEIRENPTRARALVS